jgi:hypothetical protein
MERQAKFGAVAAGIFAQGISAQVFSFLPAACRVSKSSMKSMILSEGSVLRAALVHGAFLIFCAGLCQGQTTAVTANQVDSPNYLCVQRGPHSRLWQKTTLTTNQSGDVRTNINSYTELCTGLCYLQNGQYTDSVEQINIVGAGAQAVQGPCKVQWAADASTAGGAVQLTSPGGRQFSTRVYGLALMDVSTGSNVLIATITNSTGVLMGNNQIVYPAAFSGLQADIQDTYLLSGFEQNVILREQLPSAAEYGLNPATTWLEVLTQFFNPPAPLITTVETNGVSDDVQLDFGGVGIGRGAAFLTPETGSPARMNVTKGWQQMDDGNVFLIEAVPYLALTNLLQALPAHASAGKPGAKVRRTASLKSLLRDGDALPRRSGAIRVAQAGPRRPGVVIDYSLLTGSLTNYVFQADTTYYISGTLDLYGSPILEGGTVVKYTNTAGACLKLLDYHSNFVFNTFFYRPAVFSSANDNTVGDLVSGSTGIPPTNGLATYLFAMNTTNSNVLIEHARFSYAGTAFWSQSDFSHIFRHCQFVQCETNVALYWDAAVSFQNVLAAHCGVMLAGYSINVDGEQMTVDSCNAFALRALPDWGYYLGGLTNCVLTAVDNSITNFTLKNSAMASSGTGVYQTVGAGSYYLVNGSTNRAAGTANINAALLADVQTMTTYPPVVVSAGWFTNNYTFFPQAQRNTMVLDLGYHYDSVDFAIDMAVSNAIVTVLPGTVLAGYGAAYGVYLYTNGIFNCQGTATSPNYLVQYNTVQEQSNTNWATTNWTAFFITPEQSDSSSANFAFTDWSIFTDGGQVEGEAVACPFALQNCQFYGGDLYANGPVLSATNCLFHRVNFTVKDAGSGNSSPTFYNNLFLDGELAVHHINSGQYTFRDNLFDQAAVTLSGLINVCSNNAYVTTNNGVLPPENNDIILANSPVYQVGALGQNYYPTNLSLIHAGSQSAPAAGLYHYTVTTNNVVEGTNIVSIGFHYIAVGSNGLPLDTNGDGIPDYLEDFKGNGLVDSGEINWLVGGDMGLTVIITQPANNSSIP